MNAFRKGQYDVYAGVPDPKDRDVGSVSYRLGQARELLSLPFFFVALFVILFVELCRFVRAN